jgi:hypothetical protein
MGGVARRVSSLHGLSTYLNQISKSLVEYISHICSQSITNPISMIFLVNMLNIVAAEYGNRNEHNTDTEEFKNKVAPTP